MLNRILSYVMGLLATSAVLYLIFGVVFHLSKGRTHMDRELYAFLLVAGVLSVVGFVSLTVVAGNRIFKSVFG